MAPKLSRCALPMRDACDESGRDHMMTVTTWEYILSVRLRHDTLVSRNKFTVCSDRLVIRPYIYLYAYLEAEVISPRT